MAAETSGPNTNVHFTVEVNSDQTNQDFFTAFLDNNNHEELYAFAHINYANTLKTNDFCPALEQLLHEARCNIGGGTSSEGARSAIHGFFKELRRVYSQQVTMREQLQQLETSAVDELEGVNYWKKVSAVFCTAGAATCAAVAGANATLKQPEVAAAAAAASVMFAALGKWVNSLLKKKENAVNKRREIVGVMIMGAKIAISDLANIYVLARRCHFDVGSISEFVAGGGATELREKLTALVKSFRELQGRANDGYGRDMSSVREVLLQTIIRQYYHE